MSDLSSHRDRVSKLGKDANQAEQDQNYPLAFQCYTKALEIFSHMIKCKYSSQF
jgi:MIT (microtubule interacting and transport) domain